MNKTIETEAVVWWEGGGAKGGGVVEGPLLIFSRLGLYLSKKSCGTFSSWVFLYRRSANSTSSSRRRQRPDWKIKILSAKEIKKVHFLYNHWTNIACNYINDVLFFSENYCRYTRLGCHVLRNAAVVASPPKEGSQPGSKISASPPTRPRTC